MKKTLSVSLGGRVYDIEEDAYKALDAYVNKIRAQFKNDPNVDELVSDMEAGMADVFEKQKGKRKSVVLTLENVEAMIEVMGAPEEIADEEPVAAREDDGATGPKRFYRDTDDVVVAGVCSGIARYFNIDPVIVRIGFILFAFVNGLGIIAYLILWAAMPKAETTAQKLEMRGKPVNISEIEELAKEKAHMMREEGKAAVERLRSDQKTHSVLRTILQIPVRIVGAIAKAVGAVLRALGPILSIFAGTILSIVSGAALLALSVTVGMLLFGIQSPYVHSAVPLEVLTSNPLYYVALACAFLAVLIPLVLLLTLAMTLLTRRNQFRGAVVGVMALVWMLAIGTAAGTGTHLVPQVHEYMDAYNEERTVTREFAIEDNVDALRVSEYADIHVVQGDVASAEFRGWEEDLERVTFTVEDGELHIGRLRSEEDRPFLCLFCKRLRPKGELVLPALSRVTVSDYADVSLEGFKEVEELTLDGYAEVDLAFEEAEDLRVLQSDYSRVTLDGAAASLFAELDGYARLRADDLRTDVIEVKAIDYARADVRTDGALSASAQDYGRVTYRGNPATSTIQELDFGRVHDAYAD